jgi:transcriptional regulator with XRE-family HTH domain
VSKPPGRHKFHELGDRVVLVCAESDKHSQPKGTVITGRKEDYEVLHAIAWDDMCYRPGDIIARPWHSSRGEFELLNPPECTRRTFGKMLRSMRHVKNVSIVQLANALGTFSSYLSNVELGKNPPFYAPRIMQAAQYLDGEAKPLLQAAGESSVFFTLEEFPSFPEEGIRAHRIEQDTYPAPLDDPQGPSQAGDFDINGSTASLAKGDQVELYWKKGKPRGRVVTDEGTLKIQWEDQDTGMLDHVTAPGISSRGHFSICSANPEEKAERKADFPDLRLCHGARVVFGTGLSPRGEIIERKDEVSGAKAQYIKWDDQPSSLDEVTGPGESHRGFFMALSLAPNAPSFKIAESETAVPDPSLVPGDRVAPRGEPLPRGTVVEWKGEGDKACTQSIEWDDQPCSFDRVLGPGESERCLFHVLTGPRTDKAAEDALMVGRKGSGHQGRAYTSLRDGDRAMLEHFHDLLNEVRDLKKREDRRLQAPEVIGNVYQDLEKTFAYAYHFLFDED